MPPYCIETCPPSRAISAGPDPLKGTWVMFVPARRFTMTPTRCVEAPMPPEAKVRFVVLASASNSGSVLAGTLGCTIRITGPLAIMVTAVKSLNVS
jgi:hypothetical protein